MRTMHDRHLDPPESSEPPDFCPECRAPHPDAWQDGTVPLPKHFPFCTPEHERAWLDRERAAADALAKGEAEAEVAARVYWAEMERTSARDSHELTPEEEFQADQAFDAARENGR